MHIQSNGVLSNLIQQIETELVNIDNEEITLPFDILNQTKTIDDLLLIQEIMDVKVSERSIVGFKDGRIVIPNFVSITAISPIQTAIDQLIEQYGQIESIPKTIQAYNQDIGLVVEMSLDIENQLLSDSKTIVLPATILSVLTPNIPKGTKLMFGVSQLDQLLVQETQEQYNWLNVANKNAILIQAIQSKFQDFAGSTANSLQAKQLSKLQSYARNVVVKNMARGIGTVDVILFPRVTYQVNQEGVITSAVQPLAYIIKDDIINSVQIGTDIDVRDQQPVYLDIVIIGSSLNENVQKLKIAENVQKVETVVQAGDAGQVQLADIIGRIMYVVESSLGTDYEITLTQFDSIQVFVNNEEVRNAVSIRYDEYITIGSITFQS